MNQIISSFIHSILNFLNANPIVKGSVIILLTVLVATVLAWFIFLVVKKITRRTHFDLDDQIFTIIRPAIYYSLIVSGFTIGIQTMKLSENATTLLIRFFQSCGVVIWSFFFIQLVSLLLSRVISLSRKYSFIQRRTVALFDNLAKIVIFGCGAYLIFIIWHIDMTAWLASAGIVGIAVGFAAKDSLANLFSGVVILADAPYKIGDYVVFDNGDRGKVTNIGLRSTRMLTRDDVEITIPNSIIGNSRIINQSGGPYERFRLRVKVGVAYGTDIDNLRDILLTIAKDAPLVCKAPVPRVRFRFFGTSSVDFELLCWAPSPELKGRTLDQLNDAIYKAFQENNIEIPYTKQDIYIKQLPKEVIQSSTETTDKHLSS